MYIYIHIPFCSHICSYCDFPKLLYNKKYIDEYLDSLEREIKLRYKGDLVKSIYIGGGTPTSLDVEELDKLFKILNIFNKDKEIEFSVESNVESLNDDKIKLLKKNGVNRVSLGVQSFDDNILNSLNRFHNKKDVFNVVSKLKKNSINNISIDLIYGVNSDMEVIKRDIDCFLELDIPHISCYSLIIEDNTLFGISGRDYIKDDVEYEMYNYINNKLNNNGYIHYEVSNYARDGYYSKHNLNYWNNGEYMGFGLGAVSYINNYRISNTRNLSKYLECNYIDNKKYEDKSLRMSNTLILGLRKISGINVMNFNKKFDCNLLDLYNIRELIDNGMLLFKDNYLFINPKYFYLSNNILINFI